MAFIGRTREPIMYFGANQETQELAKFLRKKLTPAENLLWQRLRNRNVLGMAFRRQHPIFYYVADFYCHELRLVVEVDGPVHIIKERAEKDLNRTAEFERFGLKVIRFTNQEITSNLNKVIQSIKEEIKERMNSLPTL